MAAEKAPVYIIGHKNPDTDSICSAIAYAELKNRLHGDGYCAARAGQINQETHPNTLKMSELTFGILRSERPRGCPARYP